MFLLLCTACVFSEKKKKKKIDQGKNFFKIIWAFGGLVALLAGMLGETKTGACGWLAVAANMLPWFLQNVLKGTPKTQI